MYRHLSISSTSPSGLVWNVSRGPRKEGSPAGCLEPDGYYSVRVGGVLTPAHVIVWLLSGNTIPDGFIVDHIDNNHTNNSPGNLRLATRAQNNRNTPLRCDNKLGVKGVSKFRNKFRGSIKAVAVLRQQLFDTVEEAEAWVTALRKELHGEFARVG